MNVMKAKILGMVLGFVGAPAFAAEPFKVTHDFVAGQKANADDVNKNFEDVEKAIDGIKGSLENVDMSITTLGTGISDLNGRLNSQFDGDLAKELTGTVGIAATTKQVNGVGTSFTTEINVGDGLLIAGEKATVTRISSDTVLQLDTDRVNGVVDVKAYTDNDLLTLKNGAGVTQSIIDKSGNLMRHIAYASGASNDDTDSDRIVSRTLPFKKRFDQETALRIGYTDNFRVYGTEKACRWEIRVDKKPCPSQALIYDFYVSSQNIHKLSSVFGYCGGVKPGAHEIQVWVSSSPGYPGSDCWTGWNDTTWALEAEEVFVQ